MTIIQPNKKNKLNFLISILMLILAVVAVWSVFLYNQLVDFRHEIASYEKSASETEVKNAELKNELFQIVNPKNLESLMNDGALVLEKNPTYIKEQQLVKN
ncbi:MAG: hypothetical protein UW50_C0001G0171 [Candidatus Wolfebacteria bacterium GW2011_GWA1_44_24]|uniref:Cell division protein FtsL n=2 Tax=Candidatus Wolfeibacteriota TaxID=1752735 RepID=A0A0G0UIW5_9BACT|nr:MAG: hypothetical protein UU38_C0003G0004 [Candidatus Wolfebacteria bacterium GW2011_GWB1_41_12]KKT56603.1 MAG: hypothetical protein UW50_C0001G0171 [Candidatus Wolfebacteria bacterium GW2011_GWA1_44_24]